MGKSADDAPAGGTAFLKDFSCFHIADDKEQIPLLDLIVLLFEKAYTPCVFGVDEAFSVFCGIEWDFPDIVIVDDLPIKHTDPLHDIAQIVFTIFKFKFAPGVLDREFKAERFHTGKVCLMGQVSCAPVVRIGIFHFKFGDPRHGGKNKVSARAGVDQRRVLMPVKVKDDVAAFDHFLPEPCGDPACHTVIPFTLPEAVHVVKGPGIVSSQSPGAVVVAEDGVIVIFDLAQIFFFRVEFVIHEERKGIGISADPQFSCEISCSHFLSELGQKSGAYMFHAVLSGDDGKHRTGSVAFDPQPCDVTFVALAICKFFLIFFHNDSNPDFSLLKISSSKVDFGCVRQINITQLREYCKVFLLLISLCLRKGGTLTCIVDEKMVYLAIIP